MQCNINTSVIGHRFGIDIRHADTRIKLTSLYRNKNTLYITDKYILITHTLQFIIHYGYCIKYGTKICNDIMQLITNTITWVRTEIVGIKHKYNIYIGISISDWNRRFHFHRRLRRRRGRCRSRTTAANSSQPSPVSSSMLQQPCWRAAAAAAAVAWTTQPPSD